MPQHDTQRPRTAWKLGQWLGSGYRAFLRKVKPVFEGR